MADGKIIKHNQIAEEGIIRDYLQKEFEDLVEYLPIVKASLADLAKTSNSIFKKFNLEEATLSDIQKLNIELKKTNDLALLNEKLKKMEAQSNTALSAQRKAEINEKKAQIDLDQKKLKINENSEKNQKRALSVYSQLSKQLRDQKNAVKDLLASEKELSDNDLKLIKNTQELDAKLKHIDKQVGDNFRNVGSYKEALQDIQAEMGQFGGLISKITRTLKTLEEQGEHNTTKMQKFGNVMKAVGIGVGLALIAMAVEAREKAEELSNRLGNIAERLAALKDALIMQPGNVFGGGETSKQMNIYINKLQQSRIELRGIALDLQRVNIAMDEENQKAADVTIGFNERLDAQKESIKLSVESADKSKQIAAIELDNINARVKAIEIGNGKENVGHKIKEEQLEAQKKYNEAVAFGDLLELENATKIRQLNSEKTNEEIDLILKKRESANAQKVMLEEQLKDERNQLEERRLISEKLLKYNEGTVKEELRIFKEGYNIKFNSNELLKEQDAVILANKIKNLKTLERDSKTHKFLGLGEAGVTELAKIVKQSQENQIENSQKQAKLDEETLRRKQKIAEIEGEIEKIKADEIVHANEYQVKSNKDLYQQLTKDVLEHKKIFDLNGKVIKKGAEERRKMIFDELKKSIDEETKAKEDALELQAKNDRIAATNSIKDEKIRAAEIKKINEKLKSDLFDLKNKSQDELIDTNQQQADDDKKIKIKKIEDELQMAEAITGGLDEGLKKRADIQQLSDQKTIDQHTRAIDVQTKLASEGRQNVLAQEIAQSEKAENKKLQDAKKAQKQQEGIQLANLIMELTAAYAKEGNVDNPEFKALAVALTTKGIAAAVAGSAFEGISDTGGEGTLDSKGGKAWILHPHEGVVKREANENYTGAVEAMNQGSLENWAMENIYIPQFKSANTTRTSIGSYSHDERLGQIIETKFASLQKTIENKPSQSVNLGRIGEWSEEIQMANQRMVINHFKKRARI